MDEDTPTSPCWLISCDESGTGGGRFYGFGSLWFNWTRRGDFAALVSQLRDLHGYQNEFKWNRVAEYSFEFYKDLIEKFFETSRLSFHCIVFERAVVKKEFHDGDYDLARRKHFAELIVNKIKRRIALAPETQQRFRIWVDPIASSYEKADEALNVIANRELANAFGGVGPIEHVATKNSKETPSIQLAIYSSARRWLLGSRRSAMKPS